MDAIVDVIERLEKHLLSFEKNQDLNSARMAAEAISKIILLNSENIETNKKANQNNLNVLIESLTKSNLSTPENHLKKIRDDLKRIQTFGNIESHDNADSVTTDELSRVTTALESLLKNVFDSKDIIYIDQKLPDRIFEKINKFTLNSENWRCEKIISIVYPNRKVVFSEKSNGLEFYVIEDADRRKVGLLFLGRNISFSSAFSGIFKSKIDNIKELSSLTFLFPTEISKATGTSVKNRKDNIIRISSEFTNSMPALKCSYEFIEDYIWDRCLPDSEKTIANPPEEPYFIDQKIHSASHSLLSLDFIDSIVKNKIPEKKPIYLIFGDGGVGKTTFCDQAVQKINEYHRSSHKKKAMLLSSFDIPDDTSPTNLKVDSIQSLYALLSQNDEISIDPLSLGLNISSGNLLIIIDGLDEIQSRLKEGFLLEKFIDSVSELNDTYLNCSVIITSREINDDVFKRDDISISHIKGFDENLIEKYLKKRFKQNDSHIYKAKDYIKEINKDSEITPLIIRLICELVIDDAIKKSQPESKYFIKENPLDKVVFQLIDREIEKQSLGITCDEYFDILKDIVFEFSGIVKKEDFDYLVSLMLSDRPIQTKKVDGKNFYLSPLLLNKDNSIKIKYDSLEFWVKARYLTYLINEKNSESNKNILRVLAQDCYKGGVLVKEIYKQKNAFNKYESSILIEKTKELAHEKYDGLDRKLISSLLYIAFEGKSHDKSANSRHLLGLFSAKEGDKLKGISIYGDFYPLDFNLFSVENGYFNDYSNLSKCNIPNERVSFYYSCFENINKEGFGKDSLTRDVFDVNCSVCEELLDVIESGIETRDKKIESVKSDLTKIFKVGFKSGTFFWKSEQLYRQQCATLKTKVNLTLFLDKLVQDDIFVKESAKTSAGIGYRINDKYTLEVKDFLTQRIVGMKLESLINKLTLS